MSDLPPPPPPPPPAGPTPTEQVSWDATPYHPVDAFKYAWERFSKKPGTTFLPVLVGVVGEVIVLGILYSIWGAVLFALNVTAANTGSSATASAGTALGFIGGLVLYILTALVSQIVYAGWAKAGLDTTRGLAPSLGEDYQGWSKTDVAVTALIMAVVIVVPEMFLGLLPVLGGVLSGVYSLAVGFLLQFAVLYVVDQGLHPTAALRASVDLVMANYQKLLVFSLLAIVVLVVGFMLIGIGTLVAFPLVVLASAFTYRKLLGQPVAR